MTTPSPLTAAIEAAEKEFDEWYKRHIRDYTEEHSVAPRPDEIKAFYRTKLQEARALGKQEGMDEGAASAVEYLRKNILLIDTKDINAPTFEASTEELDEMFEAARTAHGGDGTSA